MDVMWDKGAWTVCLVAVCMQTEQKCSIDSIQRPPSGNMRPRPHPPPPPPHPPTPPHPPDSGRRGSGDKNNQTGPGHIYTHTHTDSHTNTRVSLRRIKLWNCPERWSFKACMFGQGFLTNAGSCQSKLIIQWQSRSSTTTGILCTGQTGKKSQKCFREFLFFMKEIVKWGRVGWNEIK